MSGGGSAPHQGATTDVTEADRLRSGISSLLETINNDVPCSFWACEGPDAGLIAMKTCKVCAAVIEVRALLGAGETTEETHD